MTHDFHLHVKKSSAEGASKKIWQIFDMFGQKLYQKAPKNEFIIPNLYVCVFQNSPNL